MQVHPSAQLMPNLGIWTDFKKQTIINAPFTEPGYLNSAFLLQTRKKKSDIVTTDVDSRGAHVRMRGSC